MRRPRVAVVGFDFFTERQPNGCLLWTGNKQVKGYGDFELDGVRWLAHRYAWTRKHGPIPEGMQVLHKCDTPACVEDACLFLGTNADNHADKMAKGRQGRGWVGEKSPVHVLTENLVRWIDYLRHLGATETRIAEIVGSNRGTVRSVLIRRAWKHVKPFNYSSMEV